MTISTNLSQNKYFHDVYNTQDARDQCIICFEDFKTGQDISGHTIDHEKVQQCSKHFFHKDCLKNWLTQNKKNECPLCKQKITQLPVDMKVRVDDRTREIARERNDACRSLLSLIDEYSAQPNERLRLQIRQESNTFIGRMLVSYTLATIHFYHNGDGALPYQGYDENIRVSPEQHRTLIALNRSPEQQRRVELEDYARGLISEDFGEVIARRNRDRLQGVRRQRGLERMIPEQPGNRVNDQNRGNCITRLFRNIFRCCTS